MEAQYEAVPDPEAESPDTEQAFRELQQSLNHVSAAPPSYAEALKAVVLGDAFSVIKRAETSRDEPGAPDLIVKPYHCQGAAWMLE